MARQHYIDGVLAWPDKSDAALKDYGYVFTPSMDEDDYLTSVSVTVTDGQVVIVGDPAVTTIDPYPANQAIMVWLGEGAAGEVCELYIYCTTAKGGIQDATVKIRIKSL